ncbi:hypothetical protein [Dongia rigui]|uniref:DUF3828 domain-containing protein n=1 Tax=Dongia rigui TaxID=940149 RepID=A0ABU5E0U9_9PROT|nr:hypothetical protein [Dongia rigui]MDY0872917.1 hypothetical protein [Dongia rigui]
MTRRQLLKHLLSLALLPLGARRAAADDTPPIPFVAWVERFYRTQIAARALREGWATPENQQGAEPTASFPLPNYLTPELRALFEAAQGKPLPADTPEGPILDYVFGWGALPNREIKLLSVTEAPWWQSLITKHLALVTITINGNERDLTLKGQYDADTFNWRIADIDYGDGAGESLRERLERLAH